MNLDTVIALNRFGLGARPGELDKIDGDHERWLKDQLAGPSHPPAAFRDLDKTPEILLQVQEVQQMRRATRKAEDEAFLLKLRDTIHAVANPENFKMITDKMQETTEHNPYGSIRFQTGTEVSNYNFTDQELDPETGLYYVPSASGPIVVT